MAEKARIVFTPATGEALSVEPVGRGEGVFLPRGDVQSFLPVPQWDEEFADSPDVEGARRTRSRAQNPVGQGSVIISGHDQASFKTWYRRWEKLVEDMRQYGGTLEYTPAGDDETITYLVESMHITDAPYDGTSMRAWVQQYGFEFNCLPFGLLPEVEANLRDHDHFSFDSITNQDWLFDEGSGTLSVNEGALVPSSTSTRRLYRTGTKVSDSTHVIEVAPEGSVASGVTCLILKRLGSNANYLFATLTFGGASSRVKVQKRDVSVNSTLKESGTFTLAVGTTYWLEGSVSGNEVTVAVYAEDPRVEPDAAALASVSYTLEGADATKFGTGVWGEPGLYIQPASAEYRWDDWSAEGVKVRSSKPLAAFEVPDVGGNVSALGDLKLTDVSSELRRHAEIGVEGLKYSHDVAPPVLLDSDSLVTTGFTGTQTTRTGAYDPAGSGNSCIYARLLETPSAICGTGPLEHAGRYRVKVRTQATSVFWWASSGTTSAYYRFAWRSGDGQWRRGDWVSGTSASQWIEVDLGVFDIPVNPDGDQRWEGRVEVYSPIITSGYEPYGYIDYLLLVGAEPWARAGSSVTDVVATTVAVEDQFQQAEDASFTGNAAPPQAKTWTAMTGSDATDFASTGSSTEVLKRKAKEDAGTAGALTTLDGRAIGIDANLGDCAVETEYLLPAVAEGKVQTGVIVRALDNQNFLVVRVWETYPEGWWFTSFTHVKAEVWVGGEVKYSKEWEVTGGTSINWGTANYGTLQVLVVGETFTILLDVGNGLQPVGNGNYSSLGTTLATGDVYLWNGNTGTEETTTYWDSFTAYAIDTSGPIISASRWAKFRAFDAVRQSEDGTTVVGPLPGYEGGRLRVPCVGSGETSRLSFKARRLDPNDGMPDEPLTDELEAELRLTPRVVLL